MADKVYGFCGTNKCKREVYPKEQVDAIKTEIDTSLAGKSDTSHNHDDRYYTKTQSLDWLVDIMQGQRYMTDKVVNLHSTGDLETFITVNTFLDPEKVVIESVMIKLGSDSNWRYGDSSLGVNICAQVWDAYRFYFCARPQAGEVGGSYRDIYAIRIVYRIMP